MSGRLWLIVEDENDGFIIRKILAAKGFRITVEIIDPSGASGGISRLAAQLKQIIRTIRINPKYNQSLDCIAVLHDADVQRQQQFRGDYDRIESTCRGEQIKRAVARDELEAWMLADSGLCAWLAERPRNWDEVRKPSETLRSILNTRKNMKYQGTNRRTVLEHLAGDGDQHSPSMRAALQHLENAPCVQP